MRRRAERIDGRLTIAPRAGGGTVVALEFSPNATR
jgi:nitrate/nitrite-specific signal transduction histidine kinase